MKPKTCKVCGTQYMPFSSTAKACSYECALVLVKIKQKNAQDRIRRKETKLARDKLKTKREWLKEAQVVFNAYIRKRDEKLPCISCQRHHQGQHHAGHYRTVGANPELRFSELNCHKQCAPCNNHLSGNIVNYRINLLIKIGQKNLEWLEGSHQLQKLTIEEIKEIKQYYKDKLNECKDLLQE